MKILLDRIDEPGLNTLEVYERRGGYQSLRKALGMSPDAAYRIEQPHLLPVPGLPMSRTLSARRVAVEARLTQQPDPESGPGNSFRHTRTDVRSGLCGLGFPPGARGT